MPSSSAPHADASPVMQPADIRAAFESGAWESPGPNVRFKAIRRNGIQLRLVEFSRGFAEHDWCGKKHVGYVLSGELAALPVTDTVTLFLVEDA